ncbi:LCP family protein [Herpetosiphon gulosus]|uniref:Polyisoprenyl-teichoic acid--peptidoglycan teichoic acid transferase TagU n=1 Tax=Herpetosiphon gulosus TaxID=1973496 RepID=A0ABP9X0U8_9CHLR
MPAKTDTPEESTNGSANDLSLDAEHVRSQATTPLPTRSRAAAKADAANDAALMNDLLLNNNSTAAARPRPRAVPRAEHEGAYVRVPKAVQSAVGSRPTSRPLPPKTAPVKSTSRGAGCGMIMLGVLLTVVLVGGGGALWAYLKVKNATSDALVTIPTQAPNLVENPNNPNPQPNQPLATPDIVKDPFNLLLIGVDLRENDTKARTDTIIVLHIDPTQKWASMVSIPRDSCAEIPGYDAPGTCSQRINAAYELGYKEGIAQNMTIPSTQAMALTRDTVANMLNINIDYVAQVDFKGFRKIVDAVGGITIDVQRPLWDATYPTDDDDYGVIRLFIPAGLQHMDGTTALRYARSRHQDADYGRSRRQQDVIRALIQTLKDKGLLDQIDSLDNLAEQLKGSFYTDLPIDDLGNLRALAGLGSDIANGRIKSVKWDTSSVIGYMDESQYVPIWDPASIAATVDQLLTSPIPDTNSPVDGSSNTPSDDNLSIEVINGAQISGLAGDVATHLENREYQLLNPSTASTVYDTTKIIDFGNHKDLREQLAAELGISNRNIIVVSKTSPAPEQPKGDAALVLLLGRDYDEAWRKP